MRTLSPPRVLVTGGSGSSGRHVVPALLEEAAGVTVADKWGYPPAYDLKSGLSMVWTEFSEAAK